MVHGPASVYHMEMAKKSVRIIDASILCFSDLAEDQRGLWLEALCMVCGQPATHMVFGRSEDYDRIWPDYGTPEQREFIQEYRCRLGTTMEFPVCDLHAEGSIFN